MCYLSRAETHAKNGVRQLAGEHSSVRLCGTWGPFALNTRCRTTLKFLSGTCYSSSSSSRALTTSVSTTTHLTFPETASAAAERENALVDADAAFRSSDAGIAKEVVYPEFGLAYDVHRPWVCVFFFAVSMLFTHHWSRQVRRRVSYFF